MKKLLFILLAFFGLSSHAANFVSFYNPNQFGFTFQSPGGSNIVIKSGALLTNITLVGAVATSTPLTVPNGGSGATTLTGIIKGNGISAFSAAAAATDYVAPGLVTTDGITMNTARLLGRTTAASGAVEEITVNSTMTLSGGTLGLSGTAITNIIQRNYTASGTWTNQSGLLFIEITMVAGGGGGGGATNTVTTVCGAGGGGAGSWSYRKLNVSQLTNATETVTIGSGGTGGGVGGAGGNGAAGGYSIFGTTNTGTHFFAPPGSGGTGPAASVSSFALGGDGGIAGTLGDLNCPGNPGFISVWYNINVILSGNGGGSLFGGAGRHRTTTTANQSLAGNPGSFGSGGSGSLTSSGSNQASKGGDGGAGVVLITEYYAR